MIESLRVLLKPGELEGERSFTSKDPSELLEIVTGLGTPSPPDMPMKTGMLKTETMSGGISSSELCLTAGCSSITTSSSSCFRGRVSVLCFVFLFSFRFSFLTEKRGKDTMSKRERREGDPLLGLVHHHQQLGGE